MSCTFDLKWLLIFTGGVDGTIVGWNYETKFARYEMHLGDPTCTSHAFIKDSKSVDALVIMEEKRLLISMSADQIIRFWNIDKIQDQNEINPPVFKFYADHINKVFPDQLTGLAITKIEGNDRVVTSDTSGRIKMFNFAAVKFLSDETYEEKEAKMSNPWFINAHRKLITSIEIIEQSNADQFDDDSEEDAPLPEDLQPEAREPWPDAFVLSAS